MKKLYYLAICLLITSSVFSQNFPYKSFYNHKDRVTAVSFSPDSKVLASGGKDNAFILQNSFTRKSILKIEEHHEPINHIIFSTDGSLVFSASENVISIVNVKSSKLDKKFTIFKGIKAMDVSNTADKVYLVGMAGTDTNQKLYEFDIKNSTYKSITDAKYLTAINLSADGTYIYLAQDKSIIRINLSDYSDKKVYAGHAGRITAMAYHKGKDKLASVDAGQVKVWNLESGQSKSFVYKKAKGIEWSRNGEYFATYVKNKIFLREIESSKEQAMFTGSNNVNAISISPSGGFIASVSESSKIQLYENPWALEGEILKPEASSQLITNAANKTNYNPASNPSQPQNKNNSELAGLSAAELAMLKSIRDKKKNEIISDVDKDIPSSNIEHQYRFALIIGNEDYSTYQTDLTNEINVDFAEKDAKIFKEYTNKTLGVPESNITLLTNATAGQMRQALAKLNKLAEVSGGQAEIIFYYAGHGLPDEVTKEAYLIPVDVSGTNVQYGIKLTDVYKTLTEHPAKRSTVILDACFSGGARNQGLLAARGVKIKPKKEELKGKLVVFSASSGDQIGRAHV